MLIILFLSVLSTFTATLASIVVSPTHGNEDIDFITKAREEAKAIQLKYSQEITVTDVNKVSQFDVGRRKRDVQVRATPSLSPPPLSKRQYGYASVVNLYNNIWVNDYTIFGNLPISVNVDTGSSISIFTKSAYSPSSLSINLGKRIKIQYLDGKQAIGDVYLDYITIAGITIQSEIVWSDEEFLFYPNKNPYQAILGFGFRQDARVPSLMEEIVTQSSLLSDTFCFTFTEGDHSGKNGSIHFGALDSSIIQEIHYTNVVRSLGSRWHTALSFNGLDPIPAMVDTGSTYTYLPVEYADKLFRTLGMKTTTIEIFKLKTLVAYMACDGPIPPLKVKLGTIEIAFTMSRQSLLIKSNQPGICFLKIVGHDVHDSNTIHAIIGNQFLMNVHLVLDRASYKMGFAQRLLEQDEQRG